jgi:hypothetical protein
MPCAVIAGKALFRQGGDGKRTGYHANPLIYGCAVKIAHWAIGRAQSTGWPWDCEKACMTERGNAEPVDYDNLVDMFHRALIHTLRKHSVADSFLDFWVPDADPVLGIAGMVDSARIAGRTEIAIRFRRTTVAPERLPELERSLSMCCTPTLTTQGDSVLLKASNMKQTATADAAQGGHGPKPTYWHAGATPEGSDPNEHSSHRWDSAELPEFGDVHPHFRPGLHVALGSLSHEGDAAAPNGGLIRVTGREGSTTLTLDVDPKSHTVRAARHTGATKPSERAILDLFCKAAEQLPIQEVADHIGLKILDLLVDPDKPVPIKGVLLPVNAGTPFMLPPRLARRAYDSYREQTGAVQDTNFYCPPPASEWQALSPDQRRDKVDYALRAFLQSEGLYPDDMGLLRVDKNKYGFPVRVTVGFSDRVPTADKPSLMRKLEQRLRRDVEPEVDLIADRAKDTSPLRRLS